jgi:hypothetical protein
LRRPFFIGVPEFSVDQFYQDFGEPTDGIARPFPDAAFRPRQL